MENQPAEVTPEQQQYRREIGEVIDALENAPVTVDIEELTTHWHCNGSYVREFFLPEGFSVVGRIHRYACINILLKGQIKIVQSDGLATTLTAPHIYISQPGEQKALRALEDSIFLNVHATDETDLQKLEDHFTVSSYEQLDRERAAALEVSCPGG